VGSNTRPPNKYTKELREPVGRDQSCDDCSWWDKKGRCVLCGTPKRPNPDYHEPPPVLETRRTVGLVSSVDHSTPANFDYPALRNPDLQWTLKEVRSGWILRTAPTDNGLWFDSKESALRWSDSMGVQEAAIKIEPRLAHPGEQGWNPGGD
jgi:hypothetical protein